MKHWLLVIEDSTDYEWSFLKKSEMEKHNDGSDKESKTKYDIQVQYLCCDNARENVDFKWVCKQEGMGMDFKYTAQSTPQQSSHVEWKFAFLQNSLWAKVANITIILENNIVTPNKDLSLFQQYFGRGRRSILSSVQKFGEMCIATYWDNFHWAKLAN